MSLDEKIHDQSESDTAPGPRTTKSLPADALALTISYTLHGKSPEPGFDALEFCANVARHSHEVCKLLKRSAKSDGVHGASPDMSNHAAKVVLKMDVQVEGDILDARLKVQEAIWSFMADVSFVTECAAAGTLIAEKIATGELSGPVRFLAPNRGQKRLVEINDDGNIHLLRPQLQYKTFKKLLQLAGELNARGVAIMLHCAHHKSQLPSITPNATKAEWIAVEKYERVSVPNGFLPSTRTLELIIDGDNEILATPECSGDSVRQAIKNDKALRVELETSQPSNPFLPDEPRLRLLRVIGVTDAPGQAELDLNEP